MSNRNNRGFSAFEILVVLTLYATIFSIITCIGFDGAKKTKFKTLRYDAIAFTYNVRTYLAESGMDTGFNKRIYLYDIVAYDSSYNIVSPFSEDHNCSLANSYVDMKDDKALVTLECDNYVLYEYDSNKKNISIYRVSNLMEEKPKVGKNAKVDEVKVYNYRKNGKYVLKEFLPEEAFVNAYNRNENTKCTSLKEITSYDFKTVYRIRKAVEL